MTEQKEVENNKTEILKIGENDQTVKNEEPIIGKQQAENNEGEDTKKPETCGPISSERVPGLPVNTNQSNTVFLIETPIILNYDVEYGHREGNMYMELIVLGVMCLTLIPSVILAYIYSNELERPKLISK